MYAWTAWPSLRGGAKAELPELAEGAGGLAWTEALGREGVLAKPSFKGGGPRRIPVVLRATWFTLGSHFVDTVSHTLLIR